MTLDQSVKIFQKLVSKDLLPKLKDFTPMLGAFSTMKQFKSENGNQIAHETLMIIFKLPATYWVWYIGTIVSEKPWPQVPQWRRFVIDCCYLLLCDTGFRIWLAKHSLCWAVLSTAHDWLGLHEWLWFVLMHICFFAYADGESWIRFSTSWKRKNQIQLFRHNLFVKWPAGWT